MARRVGTPKNIEVRVRGGVDIRVVVGLMMVRTSIYLVLPMRNWTTCELTPRTPCP